MTGMLAGSYLVSVIPLYSYQFLYLRVSSNYPFYLLVLLVSSRCITCGPSGLLPLVSRVIIMCCAPTLAVQFFFTELSTLNALWTGQSPQYVYCSAPSFTPLSFNSPHIGRRVSSTPGRISSPPPTSILALLHPRLAACTRVSPSPCLLRGHTGGTKAAKDGPT